MLKFLLVLAAMAVLAVGLGVLGSRGPEGNPDVYDRISSLTDCSELQREFDIADSNRSISADPKIQTSYMEAAHARMREIGCYG